MDKQVELPALAESIVEAEIVQWLVAEGDTVELDQPLLEVSSDKVTVELPSPYAGTLTARLVETGETAAVGAPVARIDDAQSGEAAADQNAAASASDAGEQPAAEETAEPAKATQDSAADDDGDSLSLFKPSSGAEAAVTNPFLDSLTSSETRDAEPANDGPHERPRAVPAARIAAQRLGVDIADVPGSGPIGRIRVDDVRRHAEGGPGKKPAPAAAGADGLAPLGYDTPIGYADRERREPLRGMRRAIARQMTASHLHAVRTLVVEEADMTRLKALRDALRSRAEARGVRLSYLPFVFKALVSALQAYPELNTSLDEVNDEIVHKDYYNIGLAVAVDQGLMVPVVRDVDTRSLIDTAAEINRLAEGAREGSLDPAELRGSTCSVTNIGAVGGLMSFPIINTPDAAILGVHAIRERPVAIDGEVRIRPMMYLSLSFDHRLVDGATATAFLMAVIGLLERPEELLLDAV